MAVSDAEFVELADLSFLAAVRVQVEHPRSEFSDRHLRYFASRVIGLHQSKGVAVPDPVRKALEWAMADDRDAATGRRRDIEQ